MQARLEAITKQQADSDSNVCYGTIYYACDTTWQYKYGYKLWVSVDKRMLCEMPLEEGGEMQCINAKGCTAAGIEFLPKDSFQSCESATFAATRPICDGLRLGPGTSNANNYANGAQL